MGSLSKYITHADDKPNLVDLRVKTGADVIEHVSPCADSPIRSGIRMRRLPNSDLNDLVTMEVGRITAYPWGGR